MATKTKRPHPSATKADTPCETCGGLWLRHTIRMDLDAEELPIRNPYAGDWQIDRLDCERHLLTQRRLRRMRALRDARVPIAAPPAPSRRSDEGER